MARTTVAAQLARIRKEKALLERQENALINRARDRTLSKIVQLAKDNGVTAEDIAAAMGSGKTRRAAAGAGARAAGAKRSSTPKKSAAGSKAPAKYRNPADAAQTWTGRGRLPAWAVALKQAGTLATALIG